MARIVAGTWSSFSFLPPEEVVFLTFFSRDAVREELEPERDALGGAMRWTGAPGVGGMGVAGAAERGG
jgi:hypothetical protein